jgi:hypothetical protein
MKPYLLCLLLVACSNGGDSGALGNTDVSSECSPTDFACVTAGLDGPVAVGGVLPLSIDADTTGASGAAMTLMSADPTILKTADTEVIGMAPGVAALVMLAEGRAIDFLHVFVVAPDRLGLHRVEEGLERAELIENVDLLVGDELIVSVEPYRESQRLVGRTSSTWTSGTTISVLHEGVPARRRIVARQPGETDLVVNSFGFDKTLHITVLP